MRGLLQRAGAAVTGDPEYRPGDLTRGAVGAVGGGVAAVFEGVAHAAGATDYRFGDVSRAVSGGLSEAGVVVGGATISFFESFQENNRQATAGGEATEAATRLGPDVQANVTKIWSAFFGQCYEEGAAALRQGELQPDDVLDREVFFFIGLPARTLLGTCLRTLDAPPDEPAALRLSEGLIVTEADVHPELKPLFDALCGIKQQLSDAKLTDADRSMMRFETLFGGTDRQPPKDAPDVVGLGLELEPGPEPEPEQPGSTDGTGGANRAADTVSARPELCHALAGALSALATQVTQLSFFKQNYNQILEQLDTIALEAEKRVAGGT